MREMNSLPALLRWLTKTVKSFKPKVHLKWNHQGQVEQADEAEGEKSKLELLRKMDMNPQAWCGVPAGSKFSKALIIIENCVKAKRKSVFYCPWLHPLHLLHGCLIKKYGKEREIFYLTGEQVTVEEKTMNLNAFKRSRDPSAILLANPHTGGMGISITEASVCGFLCSSWNPQVDMQCVCRSWRKGREELYF